MLTSFPSQVAVVVMGVRWWESVGECWAGQCGSQVRLTGSRYTSSHTPADLRHWPITVMTTLEHWSRHWSVTGEDWRNLDICCVCSQSWSDGWRGRVWVSVICVNNGWPLEWGQLQCSEWPLTIRWVRAVKVVSDQTPPHQWQCDTVIRFLVSNNNHLFCKTLWIISFVWSSVHTNTWLHNVEM